MPSLGPKSLEVLSKAHPDLQRLFKEVGSKMDITILCSHRTKEEQDAAFKAGNSKVQFPNSKHNQLPSLAVDAAPYPLDWKDEKRFYYLAGFVRSEADRLGIKIRQGCDWNGNLELKDDNWQDVPHTELKS